MSHFKDLLYFVTIQTIQLLKPILEKCLTCSHFIEDSTTQTSFNIKLTKTSRNLSCTRKGNRKATEQNVRHVPVQALHLEIASNCLSPLFKWRLDNYHGGRFEFQRKKSGRNRIMEKEQFKRLGRQKVRGGLVCWVQGLIWLCLVESFEELLWVKVQVKNWLAI